MANKNHFSKKHRPFGVWILTIQALIFAGIFLDGDEIYVLKGEVAMFSSGDIPFMLLGAYLSIGIIIASVLTWMGWEPGRIFFLFLTSTFYLGLGRGMFLWIIHPSFWKIPSWAIWDRIVSVFQLVGCLLIPILYIWYFNKPSTRAFYRKVEKVT